MQNLSLWPHRGRHLEPATANAASGLSPAPRTVPSVTAGLAYVLPTMERPYRYMYEPPPGAAWHNCKYMVVSTQIADARAIPSRPSIDVEGFELCDAPSSIADFWDEDAVRSRYYPEAAALAKQLTGAEHAFVFDHAVRRRESGRPALGFGRDGYGTALGAVGHVHTDYSEASGQKRLEATLSAHKLDRVPQRFAIVNIWRSIKGQIVDTPLAICDARTVSAGDLVATDLLYPQRTGEIYLVRHSPRHRWAYFPAMDRHEALIFKQYDSQLSGVARFTPHSAFDLPDIPPDAPLRESIEVRCLVTYR